VCAGSDLIERLGFDGAGGSRSTDAAYEAVRTVPTTSRVGFGFDRDDRIAGVDRDAGSGARFRRP
jgi:hypothetical protein